ncbi:hypothetical protein RUM44_008084 [Polyplax serrata]|uniref:Uncharacterized protein n=1 Tax=Polyplax serrata TaxID=468196 RepID=A0ABR1B7Q7_POLSC
MQGKPGVNYCQSNKNCVLFLFIPEIKLYGGEIAKSGKSNRVTIIGGLAEAAHGSTSKGNSSSESSRNIPNWVHLILLNFIGFTSR